MNNRNKQWNILEITFILLIIYTKYIKFNLNLIIYYIILRI